MLKAVWVLDDNKAVTWSIVALLESEKIPASAFSNGREVLEKLARCEEPSLLFLDIGMAGIDGNLILRQIMDEPKWVFPVIVLTGDETSINADVRGRVYKVLSKTTEPLELIAHAKRAMGLI